MMGRNPGRVTSQGEILADAFQEAGYSVLCFSSLTNRYLRLTDIVSTLLRRRGEIELQCVQVFSGPSFVIADVASWLGRRFGQRVVMHLHGGNLPQFMARHPDWSRRVLQRAHALVAPSEYLADAVKPYGFRAHVIPNVIDLSQYPCRPRTAARPRLLWMRTFRSIYHPEMAVRVLARLRAEVPDATLVMAGQEHGSGPQVTRLARELGVADAVRFPGFLDMAGKAREGNAADIFLNTNRVDNMPVSVVEACAMGLAVVATAVGGVPRLLTDGETGLLVPDGDEEAMLRAVRRLLAEPGLFQRLSVNGRRLAERSSWEQVRPMWEQLFAQVLGRPAARQRLSAAA
jgi:glycosyltransferase involved in cell wall biosynthesis